MSWKILQENLFTLTQQSIQVQTAGLYCVFNALGYWNPNIAANTRYKYTSYFRFGSLCAQVHIKMHFSGQQKHIFPFAELNAGYVTWVNIKCAWTITAPQQTQTWSQNEKDNYYIYIPIYWVHVPGNEKNQHSCLSAIETTLPTHLVLLLRGYFGFLKWLMLFPLVWILIVFWHFHLLLHFLNKDCCNGFF